MATQDAVFALGYAGSAVGPTPVDAPGGDWLATKFELDLSAVPYDTSPIPQVISTGGSIKTVLDRDPLNTNFLVSGRADYQSSTTEVISFATEDLSNSWRLSIPGVQSINAMASLSEDSADVVYCGINLQGEPVVGAFAERGLELIEAKTISLGLESSVIIPQAIAVDPCNGQVAVAGSYSDPLDDGVEHMFILTLSPELEVVASDDDLKWGAEALVQETTATGSFVIGQMLFDEDANLVIAGLTPTATYGDRLSDDSSGDIFIVKYKSNGVCPGDVPPPVAIATISLLALAALGGGGFYFREPLGKAYTAMTTESPKAKEKKAAAAAKAKAKAKTPDQEAIAAEPDDFEDEEAQDPEGGDDIGSPSPPAAPKSSANPEVESVPSEPEANYTSYVSTTSGGSAGADIADAYASNTSTASTPDDLRRIEQRKARRNSRQNRRGSRSGSQTREPRSASQTREPAGESGGIANAPGVPTSRAESPLRVIVKQRKPSGTKRPAAKSTTSATKPRSGSAAKESPTRKGSSGSPTRSGSPKRRHHHRSRSKSPNKSRAHSSSPKRAPPGAKVKDTRKKNKPPPTTQDDVVWDDSLVIKVIDATPGAAKPRKGSGAKEKKKDKSPPKKEKSPPKARKPKAVPMGDRETVAVTASVVADAMARDMMRVAGIEVDEPRSGSGHSPTRAEKKAYDRKTIANTPGLPSPDDDGTSLAPPPDENAYVSSTSKKRGKR